MKKLDILMIHPNASSEIYQELSNEHSAIEPPIWAAMLAKSCILKGFDAQILDCEVERLNYLESAKKINEINPKIACFVVYGQQPSASTQNMEGAINLVRELKKLNPNIKTLFVGGHIAALPLETLSYPEIDFICQNEGVYTIIDLLSCDLDTSNLSKIKGLGWKNDNHPTLNPINRIVSQEDLMKDLPGMAWNLLPSLSKYRTAGWHAWPNGSIKSPFASLYTSLGCPFKCFFCCINIINKTDSNPNFASDKSAVFRYWKPEDSIKEFDYLANQGVKNIKIADEMFVLREQHFMELCKLIIERKYNFNIWCYGRVDVTKHHHLATLKKAGVNFIGLGIESPNQTVRKDVIKGGYQEIKIVDVIKNMRDEGINIGANYIFGLPEDTLESMKETLDFAIDMNTENANFYSTMAYPGSPLYLQAKTNGWKLPDRYSGYSQHSYYTQNLPSKYVSAEEIMKFRDEAWMTYFTNPSYLEMMKSKFGQESVDNINATTKIKLKRRLLGD